MADGWRKVAVFGGGLLLGVLLTAALMLGLRGEAPAPRAGTPAPEVSLAPPAPAAPAEQTAAPVAARPAAPAVPPVACAFDPLLAQAGERDGQFRLQSLSPANRAGQVDAFRTVAREASGEGRTRDAEVAFIMACRVAGQVSGAESAQAADARIALARHYAVAAAGAGDGTVQRTLLQRAEALLQDGVRSYGASLGSDHPRTRQAAQWLAALGQGQLEAFAGAATALGAARASAPPSEAAAPGQPHEDLEPQRAGRPSFDCGQARSAAERLICSDAELAQLDRDLGRLHAQARSVTGDPAGFRQRHEQAWAWRESNCRDRACLLRWYETRRRQLIDEFGAGSGSRRAAQR